MQALNIGAYQGLFRERGVARGCDLQGLDDGRLEEMGVVDGIHRLVITECLNELTTGSSSIVSDCRVPLCTESLSSKYRVPLYTESPNVPL